MANLRPTEGRSVNRGGRREKGCRLYGQRHSPNHGRSDLATWHVEYLLNIQPCV